MYFFITIAILMAGGSVIGLHVRQALINAALRREIKDLKAGQQKTDKLLEAVLLGDSATVRRLMATE